MKLIKTALLCATAITTLSAQAVELPSRSYLPLSMAQELANEALTACAADGYNVSVSVVDAAGLTRAIIRADMAGPHTLESSRKKAFTSASMGQPTANLVALIKKMPGVEGLKDMDDNILILGGGLPVVVNNEKVGGIGVGGAPGGHLDQACAQAALDKVLGS